MAVIAQTSDRWGRTVELTDVAWQHILQEHAADLAGRQADVLRAVERPDRVNFDADYADRESFYRAVTGRGSGRPWYLKVCIEYGPVGGTIVTAYLTDRIKRREQRRWP